MNQVLDKKLFNLYKWPSTIDPGCIGIEIEVEGRNLPAVFGQWIIHDDGSLRGEASAEYVLRNPLPRSQITTALNYLSKCFDDSGAVLNAESDRTSVHIHFNMREKTMREIYTFWTVWCIVEDLSFALCGPERRGNLFCMRLMDCEAMIEQARYDLNPKIKEGLKFQYFQGDSYRYSACNMASLRKFGSVEFRGMHGTIDIYEIETWVDFLQCVITGASRFKDPQEVIEKFSRWGVDQWVRNTLKLPYYIERKLLGTPNARRMLWDGMRLAQDIAWVLPSWDTEKREIKPPEEDEQLIQREIEEEIILQTSRQDENIDLPPRVMTQEEELAQIINQPIRTNPQPPPRRRRRIRPNNGVD